MSIILFWHHVGRLIKNIKNGGTHGNLNKKEKDLEVQAPAISLMEVQARC